MREGFLPIYSRQIYNTYFDVSNFIATVLIILGFIGLPS